MKRLPLILLLIFLLVGFFLAGVCYEQRGQKQGPAELQREAASSATTAGSVRESSTAPSIVVEISPEKQQLIGLKTATIKKIGGEATLRALGRVAADACLYALGALDRFQASGKETPEQIALTAANIQQYKNTLKNLGMGDLQIEEIARNRFYTEKIHVYSPLTGFILAHNISGGREVREGDELTVYPLIYLIWKWHFELKSR